MNTTGTESVKAWLLELRAAITDAELTEERLDALRSRAESARTASLSGLPHAAGETVDRVGVIVTQIDELTKENARLWQKVGELRREREAAIKQIHGKALYELAQIVPLEQGQKNNS